MPSARWVSLRVMVYLILSSSEKAPNASNRLFAVLLGGLSAQRQRDDVPPDRPGLGKRVVAQLQARMVPHRLWPADQGFDSSLFQRRPQLVTPRGSDHIVLVDVLVLIAGKVRKHNLCDTSKTLAVPPSNFATVLNPFGNVRELEVQYRSLHVVQQCGLTMVMEFAGFAILSVVPHQGDRASDFGVVGSNCAAVSKSAEELEGVKAETTGE